MYTFKLIYLVFLLFSNCSQCSSFDQYQSDTGQILDLLGKKGSNKHLINTVVNCMGKTFHTNGKSTDFVRCVNDLVHTDPFTNRDDIKYIMGNYAARSARLLMKCYSEKSDLMYCLRVFGECLPLMLRQLYGVPEYSRKCKRLVNLPKYDTNDSYLRDQDMEDEEFDTFDDEDVDDLGSEYDDDYDYDYDDEYDEYDDEYGDDDYYGDDDLPDEFEDFRSEKKISPLSIAKRIQNYIKSKTESGSEKSEKSNKVGRVENLQMIEKMNNNQNQHHQNQQHNLNSLNQGQESQVNHHLLEKQVEKEEEQQGLLNKKDDGNSITTRNQSDTESMSDSVEVIDDPDEITGEIPFEDSIVKNIQLK